MGTKYNYVIGGLYQVFQINETRIRTEKGFGRLLGLGPRQTTRQLGVHVAQIERRGGAVVT